MKRLIAAVFIALFLVQNARSTSIVILYNADKIVVAGDSKVYKSSETICKIYRIGSIYWAMSGITGNSVTGYDVAKIVKNSYARGQGVAKTFDIFTTAVVDPLRKTLIHLRPYPDFQFLRYNPLEIAFWAIEHGHPVVAHVFYTTKVSGKRLTVITIEKETATFDDPRRADGILLGVKGKISQYIVSHKDWSSGGALEASAYKFVSLSIQESPDSVGYPVSELLITRIGEQWIKPNECCHGDVQEGPPPLPEETRLKR